jgi:hypothetical protein
MSQLNRVKIVLAEADNSLSLWEIKERIQAVFGQIDSEAAISARIRDIRAVMEKMDEGTILGIRVEGKAWQRYAMQFSRNQIGAQRNLFAT